MDKKLVQLEHPSSELINKHLTLWANGNEKYPIQERALNYLFTEACPKQDNFEDVIIKVSALNDFYSANIFDTFSVARHILSIKNVGLRLNNGDLTLVDEIASVPNRPKYYSFASKYCSHHNPEFFPIYDSYVAEVLKYFRRKDRFTRFKNEELKKYQRFVEIIKIFKEHYKIDNKYTLRDIDIYLWQTGKQNFPQQYTKPKSSKSNLYNQESQTHAESRKISV